MLMQQQERVMIIMDQEMGAGSNDCLKYRIVNAGRKVQIWAPKFIKASLKPKKRNEI
jgi:hypothetical protein